MTARRVYQVTSYGAGLLEGSPASGLCGEVMATFRRSCYALGMEGGVMCIGDQSLDDGPLTLKARFPWSINIEALGIKEGMPLRLEEGGFTLGEGVLLRMAGATAWVPPAITISACSDEILERLRMLVHGIATYAPDGGLAPFLPSAEDLAAGRPVTLWCDSPVAHVALPAMAALVRGAYSRDEGEVDGAVRRLVGLGPGLTPSGDDLLGGMMVGLISTVGAAGGAAKELEGVAAIIRGSISRQAADGTTAISAALLLQAAGGVAAAAVHRLVQALLQPGNTQSPIGVALAVARTGHTSGWDCLVGVLLGTHLAIRLRDGWEASRTHYVAGHCGWVGRVQT